MKIKLLYLSLLAIFLLACSISTLPTVSTIRNTNQHTAEMRWQQTPIHDMAQPENNKPREWTP
jgi:hypothetical protein